MFLKNMVNMKYFCTTIITSVHLHIDGQVTLSQASRNVEPDCSMGISKSYKHSDSV